ncbi:hypothetical protein [Phreatobacter oligotrophus]|uniref:Uncharacterized protein n=1 Tax=Phreatobacter oligotrophus TaxID=1122261 RepID=A0A2T4Z591_9HYPH|nr:hypothetical protein [Phreatobacter oligotrophus]PTM57026.1 hypothetical protein C8P69_10473 [Phreatobacter oligotrophus]
MSLIPDRWRIETTYRDRISPGILSGTTGHGPRLGLLPRIVLLLVLSVIVHGFAIFAVCQIVRSYPALMTANPAVATLLCGDGGTLLLDFNPSTFGRRRGLDSWIECIDASGAIDRGAGQQAAILSGLVLSVPLCLLMVGMILRTNRALDGSHSIRVRTLPEPARWTDRMILLAFVLVIAATIAGAAGAYGVRYQPHLVDHPLARQLACGDALIPEIVYRHTRSRRLICVSAAGFEDPAASRYAMLRLLAPLYLLLVLPGIWLVARVRRVQRVRYIRRRD